MYDKPTSPYHDPINSYHTSKMSASVQKAGARLEEVKQQVEAAAPKKLSGVDLYSRFALAGAIGCAVTHGAMTPVDVYVPTMRYFARTRAAPLLPFSS